jgi:hypothetical protein
MPCSVNSTTCDIIPRRSRTFSIPFFDPNVEFFMRGYIDRVKSACPYAKDVGACQKELQKLTSLPPDGFLDSHLIASYRSIDPQVDAAISADLQAATTGQSNLANIADEVEKVYRSAR